MSTLWLSRNVRFWGFSALIGQVGPAVRSDAPSGAAEVPDPLPLWRAHDPADAAACRYSPASIATPSRHRPDGRWRAPTAAAARGAPGPPVTPAGRAESFVLDNRPLLLE